jgi:hypothetical protein
VDASPNVLEHYTKASVVSCVSSSGGVVFYVSEKGMALDCLLEGDCPVDYFFVAGEGVDFDLCGAQTSPCLTIV